MTVFIGVRYMFVTTNIHNCATAENFFYSSATKMAQIVDYRVWILTESHAHQDEIE